MKCPHCDTEIPGVTCPQCGESVPEASNYCMYCGASMREDVAPPAEEVPYDEDEEPDLENRVLCPDGSCTGIIVNGRCTECGRREGDYPDTEAAAPAPEAPETPEEKTGDE